MSVNAPNRAALAVSVVIAMHKVKFSFLLLLTLSFHGKVFSEIFSAIDELESLAHDEKFIIEDLEIMADDLGEDYLITKISLWQNEHDLMMENVTRYITNPLNAFALIKRATSDIELIKSRYPDESREFLKKIENFQPSNEDLSGAVAGLLRLQFVFKLTSEDFANGIIDGEVTRTPLTPHDLYVIGSEALKFPNEQYYAQEYLNLAWDRMEEGLDVEDEVEEDDVALKLLESYKMVGDYDGATSVIDFLIKKYPDTHKFVEAREIFESDFENDLIEKVNFKTPFDDDIVVDGTYADSKDEVLYSKVCRGNVTKSPAELSKLYCRYVSNSPFSRLARFKVEEVNLQPYIALYIDVLSDNEMKFLQTITKPKAKRAHIISQGLTTNPSSYRIAQLAWHSDRDHKIVARISKRIEVCACEFVEENQLLVQATKLMVFLFQDMTGLCQKHAEEIQVQNYGIGGHYVSHWDHRIERDEPFEDFGNRIATVLFYVSGISINLDFFRTSLSSSCQMSKKVVQLSFHICN